jgi:uncharacterized protein (UPF0216 family)
VAEGQPTPAERAVASYEESQEELDAFLRDPDIRDILLELEQLVNRRNAALDQAVRTVKNELRTSDRAKLLIGTIGAQKKWRRWYDVDFLANALPADQAELVLTETVIYELDEALLDQMTRQGEVDNQVVQKAFHEEELPPANMPGTPKPFIMPAVPVRDG